MTVDILNMKGASTGRTITLPEDIFGIQPNEHAVYLAVKQYLANQRQGTHKSKQRNEIAGSTRKIKKQKGTGGARAGSIKNPLFHGGGRVFGPQPRDYTQKLNKKVRILARKSALSSKASENQIIILDNLTFEKPKTKDFVAMLAALNIQGKVMVLTPEYDINVHLASRNIPAVNLLSAADLNTYEVLNSKKLIIAESAIQKIVEILS